MHIGVVRMDLGTGLALLGSAKLAEQLLGPTFGYLGEGLKEWTQKGINNLNTIILNAAKKLGSKIETEGSVPPKVFKGILLEGAFCDDALAAEYFGGVLASSRSGNSRDDRGASFIALISRLSAYQIRAHYVFYQIVKNLFDGRNIAATNPAGRDLMRVYIPFDVYISAMDFSEGEDIWILTSHIVNGLHKEQLIDQYFRFGGVEGIQDEFENSREAYGKDQTERDIYLDAFKQGGVVFQPSSLGVELFLWAYGKADLPIEDFLNPENEFPLYSDVAIQLGAREVKPITANLLSGCRKRAVKR
jgi:hypothetical protein